MSAQTESTQVQVDSGYIQDVGIVERYQRLSIPVRRSLNDSDRASFAQALAALERITEATEVGGKLHVPTSVPSVTVTKLDAARRAWRKLQDELNSTVGLGGKRVTRREILMAWLEAAAFYDKLDRDRAYDRVIDQWGKAAEGLGSQLMEDAAAAILQLDEAAADALGEPLILPPPPKTPPPPPDPKESLWIRAKRALTAWRSDKEDE